MELPATGDNRARVIGAIYFHLTSVDDATAEIGWAVTPGYQGRGYAAEAARAVIDVGFGPVGLHRVYAELDPRNDASVALCLRLGMRHEAHFVENMWFKGMWADTGIYGVLGREWSLPTA
jgi:RimJ/RimL family protein N-acetyltransferase